MAIKNIGILVERDYQDLEVWYPALRLQEEGANVIFIGTGSSRTYTGKYGYPVEAGQTADKVKIKDMDGIIIPGGWAPDYLRRFPAVIKLVKDMFHAGKVIASVCHGASVLCSANIISGKTITCFMAIKDDVINAGAKYVDKEVVVDGNFITSRKPEDLPAFCKAIIKAL